MIRLGRQRRRRLSVTRGLARRRRIRFVEPEHTLGTVTHRGGRGGRQSHGRARGAEGRVGAPSVEEKRGAGAGMKAGGSQGPVVKRRGDDVLEGVFR